jgi:hypothetical protein
MVVERSRAARLWDVPPGYASGVAYQVVQIALASFTVAAYAALELGFAKPTDRLYLLANLVGRPVCSL